jgi:hypothetical protein
LATTWAAQALNQVAQQVAARISVIYLAEKRPAPDSSIRR